MPVTAEDHTVSAGMALSLHAYGFNTGTLMTQMMPMYSGNPNECRQTLTKA